MSSYNIKFIISNYPQSTLEHNLRGVTIRALSPSVKKWNSTFACHSLRKGSSTCYSCFWYIPSSSEWRHPLVPRESQSLAQKVLGSSQVAVRWRSRTAKRAHLSLWKVGVWAKNDRTQGPNELRQHPRGTLGPSLNISVLQFHAKHWAKPQVNALSLCIQ
jgi:hypothetical protein